VPSARRARAAAQCDQARVVSRNRVRRRNGRDRG
jgi:hypothetical protein